MFLKKKNHNIRIDPLRSLNLVKMNRHVPGYIVFLCHKRHSQVPIRTMLIIPGKMGKILLYVCFLIFNYMGRTLLNVVEESILQLPGVCLL